MRRFRKLGVALLGLLGASACQLPFAQPNPSLLPKPYDASRGAADGLPFPTKDEVLLVDGRALSISSFFRVRSSLRSAELRKTEGVIWTSVAMVLLEEDAQLKGKFLEPQGALLIARYAEGDLQEKEAPLARETLSAIGLPLAGANAVHAQIDAWARQAKIEKNPEILAELGSGVR